MRRITSITITKDALGERISVHFSVVDEATGKITADNRVLEKYVMEKSPLTDKVFNYAQKFIDKDEEDSRPEPFIDTPIISPEEEDER